MDSGNNEGYIHPISRAIYDIRAIFAEIGFEVAVGPELEDEWHNFDALNIPKDHPAREMQDTFWLKTLINADAQDADKRGLNISENQHYHQRESSVSDISVHLRSNQRTSALLRTHTSPVQIRYMEEKLKAGIMPPYRIIVPGKVFRNEATDATHEAQFYQVEGLYVDKNVSMAHLKGALEFFFKKFFGENVEIRFRPSFFAFTEPSVEVDMKFTKTRINADGHADKRGLNIGVNQRNNQRESASSWLEMMGAGLVHPNVLRAAGVDSEKYSGFAFGGGIDRLVMLKYGIPDIRMFYGGDLRVVGQF